MTRRQPPASQPPKQPTLQVPRAEAERKIRERIQIGQELAGREIQNEVDLDALKAEHQRWDGHNFELMRRLVDTNDFERDYAFTPAGRVVVVESWWTWVEVTRKNLRARITGLETILGKLDLIPESPSTRPQVATEAEPKGNRVFLAHGHDEEMKQAVARFLERLGCKPVILHEQPDQGRTVIEKVEHYSDVAFAVVLLTPDDVGAPAGSPGALKPRARQNVMFELGFFVGSLGRQNVCALHRGGVEIPSDYGGVLWTPYDDGGAWRLKLAQELRAAGIEIKADALLS
jgi:predicted nucleotide-binding protein